MLPWKIVPIASNKGDVLMDLVVRYTTVLDIEEVRLIHVSAPSFFLY